MEYSPKFNFALPSRDVDDIADINEISNNFRIIDEQMLGAEKEEEYEHILGGLRYDIDNLTTDKADISYVDNMISNAIGEALEGDY